MSACEWCGHQHRITALCSQRPKARGMGRRSFLFLAGIGAAATVLNPLALIETPPQQLGAFGSVFKRVLVGVMAAEEPSRSDAVRLYEQFSSELRAGQPHILPAQNPALRLPRRVIVGYETHPLGYKMPIHEWVARS
jgi:hypothetical protein